MLHRDSVCRDEVQAADLCQQVLLPEQGIGVPLINVDPDQAREILRCKGELRPVFATFVVALISGRAAE